MGLSFLLRFDRHVWVVCKCVGIHIYIIHTYTRVITCVCVCVCVGCVVRVLVAEFVQMHVRITRLIR